MKIRHVASDTHFCHEAIAEMRGYRDVEEMNAAMVAAWNRFIKPDDKVYHLGDFALGSDFETIEKICQQLNGNITLVIGNHDTPKKVADIYAKYFKCCSSIYEGRFVFTHIPVHPEVLEEAETRSQMEDGIVNVHGHIHEIENNVQDVRYANVNMDTAPTSEGHIPFFTVIV